MKELRLTWTDFEAAVIIAGAPIYYFQYTGTATQYFAAFATNLFYAYTNITATADVTDFETNYKSSANPATSDDGVIAQVLGYVSTPTGSTAVVYQYASITTTVTSVRNILQYTVTTGKTFDLLFVQIKRDSDSKSVGGRARLLLSGTAKNSAYSLSGSSNYCAPTIIFEQNYWPQGLTFATSRQVITLDIQAGATTSSNWSGLLIGKER